MLRGRDGDASTAYSCVTLLQPKVKDTRFKERAGSNAAFERKEITAIGIKKRRDASALEA